MHHVRQRLEDLHRELDLLVFRLERQPADAEAALRERRGLRRELERMREQLEELTRGLD